MSKVRGRDTLPELTVRKMLFEAGYRFRLHRKDLPGKPDIVLPRYRTVIFVHGCFWHRHAGCAKTTSPKTRVDFWNTKFAENVARDKKNITHLSRMGWRSIIVWECETKSPELLRGKLLKELEFTIVSEAAGTVSPTVQHLHAESAKHWPKVYEALAR